MTPDDHAETALAEAIHAAHVAGWTPDKVLGKVRDYWRHTARERAQESVEDMQRRIAAARAQ